MSQLTEFFERLATDEDFERQFDDNPRTTMVDAGLDEAQQMLILGGTAQQIRAAIVDELPEGAIIIMVKMR
jgi:hypothetical protein